MIFVAELRWSRRDAATEVQASSARFTLATQGRESLPYVTQALVAELAQAKPCPRARAGLAMLLQQIGEKIRYPTPNLPHTDSAGWIAWANEVQTKV